MPGRDAHPPCVALVLHVLARGLVPRAHRRGGPRRPSRRLAGARRRIVEEEGAVLRLVRRVRRPRSRSRASAQRPAQRTLDVL